jgi:hypothetical protein
MIAVCQRCLKKMPDALTTLERHHPRFSLLFQERGHCHVAIRPSPSISNFCMVKSKISMLAVMPTTK